MVERLILAFVRLIADTFFRRIEVAGIDNVPESGPVIFAGNHPNALMDGWLVTAKCGRWPLHFLANAKLWNYRPLAPVLDAVGAVPVYRREDHDSDVDNRDAFSTLYELIESGACIGIFPEGISHVESQLARLKTGTARIALTIAERGKTIVPIIPCGLNYIHRHKFRSQVYIEFGTPIVVDDQWLEKFADDEQGTVVEMTDHLAEALKAVTVNAPDWRTLRIIQSARRLYKPASVKLTPAQYVELNRRFVSGFMEDRDDPEVRALTAALEDYQARLDMLDLKDHQLRRPVTTSEALKRSFLRMVRMIVLLPVSLPGALLHLPIGWAAAAVGNRFSYEQDDVATLKVFATILLLPVVYLAVAIPVGMAFGFWWGLALFVALPFSFIASVRLLEAEVGLFISMISTLRLARLGREVEDLRDLRAELVQRIRHRVNIRVDPDTERLFTEEDFANHA